MKPPKWLVSWSPFSDFKQKSHFTRIFSKTCNRLFIIRNLSKSNCPSHLIRRARVAFIRSVILYAAPCFCKAPRYLFEQLVKIQRTSLRIMKLDSSFQLSNYECIDMCCMRLFKKVEASLDQSLCNLFDPREHGRTRCARTFNLPFARTLRFKSFIY